MDYEYALACAIVPLVLYCLPLCFYRYLIRGYSLSKKYAIITVLIYGFVFSLAFSLIMSAITGLTVTPASTSFTAFYGLVSYFLLTRGGSHKQPENNQGSTVEPDEAKKDVSASVVEDAECAEECPQEDNKPSVAQEENNTTDPLPEKSRAFKEEDKPATKERRVITLKASSPEKDKVLLKVNIPSAKTKKILTVILISVLAAAVIALSIAFPLTLKTQKAKAYHDGYYKGYLEGYHYAQDTQGTTESYGTNSKYQLPSETNERGETIDERIARANSKYGH